MKLVDLLVRQLGDCYLGGWPAYAAGVVQDSDGQLCFYPEGADVFFGGAQWIIRQRGVNWVECLCGFEPADDYYEASVSKSRYEAALAASNQVAWDGAGLPPIGTKCEWQDKNTKAWLPVTVVYASEWVTVIREANKSDAVEIAIENYGDEARRQFRPIRTEAERKREDIIRQMSHSLRANGNVTNEQLRRLYDDISNGTILGVKLDN